MLSIRVLNYPVMYSLSENGSGSKHARNCVYLSKIKNSSSYQELVSYRMPEHVEKLSSLVRIKLQHLFHDNYWPRRSRVIKFLTFGRWFCSHLHQWRTSACFPRRPYPIESVSSLYPPGERRQIPEINVKDQRILLSTNTAFASECCYASNTAMLMFLTSCKSRYLLWTNMQAY